MEFCNCESPGEDLCILDENHTGPCSDGELVWNCRPRDDYPHGDTEPQESWQGPQKPRVERKSVRKSLGDFLRTRSSLTPRKIREVLKNHPDVEIPSWVKPKP